MSDIDTEMAWDGKDGSIFSTIAAIDGMNRAVDDEIMFTNELEKEAPGITDELETFTIPLGSHDKNVLVYALNLVGFFNPEAGELARDLMNRMVSAAQEAMNQLTPEQRERGEEIAGKISRRILEERQEAFLALFDKPENLH